MSIFLSKNWVNAAAECYAYIQPRRIELGDDEIYLGESNFFGFKKWRLYGEFESDVERKLALLFKRSKAERVFLVESNFNMSRWQCRDILQKQARIVMDFGTYMVLLSPSEAEIWQKVRSHHRRAIRKAGKMGVEVRFELNLTEFKELLDQTFARGGKRNRQGLPCLTAIQKNLKSNLILAGAYHEGVLQSGVVVPYDESRGYFLLAATATACAPGSSNLLHWAVIKELKSRGVKGYDLGGARRLTDDPRLQGIFKFKERFGGEFVDCYYWEKVVDQRAYTVYRALRRLRGVLTHYR